jgi:hypothetical protein
MQPVPLDALDQLSVVLPWRRLTVQPSDDVRDLEDDLLSHWVLLCVFWSIVFVLLNTT